MSIRFILIQSTNYKIKEAEFYYLTYIINYVLLIYFLRLNQNPSICEIKLMEFFERKRQAQRQNFDAVELAGKKYYSNSFNPSGREKKRRQPRMKKETAVPLKKQCQQCQKDEEMGELCEFLEIMRTKLYTCTY